MGNVVHKNKEEKERKKEKKRKVGGKRVSTRRSVDIASIESNHISPYDQTQKKKKSKGNEAPNSPLSIRISPTLSSRDKSSSPEALKSPLENIATPDNFDAKHFLFDIDMVFKSKREIGSGRFSTVYEAKHRENGKLYALKSIPHSYECTEFEEQILHACDAKNEFPPTPRRKSSLDVFTREYETLSRLKSFNNDGVVGYLQSYIDCKNYYIVTELGDMDLFTYINIHRRLKESDAKIIVIKLLETLSFLHDNLGLVHRDIKSQNIILCDNDITKPKIIDFADALIVRNDTDTCADFIGTPNYLAPERFRKHYHWELKAADVWSIGVITFEMLTGSHCFDGDSVTEVEKAVCKGDWQFPRHVKPTYKCLNFVEHLLTRNPANRPKARNCLKHAWLQLTYPASRSYKKLVGTYGVVKEASYHP